MARRNDRIMRKMMSIIVACLMVCMIGYAQEDAHLRKMTDGLLVLRKAKASRDALNKMVLSWSATGCPKITLMDDIKYHGNEYKEDGANKFNMNKVVTHVYNRQNPGMVSKGIYFNSTEREIYYSAIEKTIQNKKTVTYTISGHVGTQEFVFVSFNPNSRFSATVNGIQAKGQDGVLWVKIPNVQQEDNIVFSITNNSNSFESIVILNHNPQK